MLLVGEEGEEGLVGGLERGLEGRVEGVLLVCVRVYVSGVLIMVLPCV